MKGNARSKIHFALKGYGIKLEPGPGALPLAITFHAFSVKKAALAGFFCSVTSPALLALGQFG